MYKISQEDYEKWRGPLMRHYVRLSPAGRVEPDKHDEERTKLQEKFINSYFTRFIRTGGHTTDHYDTKRSTFDDYGIPQDLSRAHFVLAQKEFGGSKHDIDHIPDYFRRHFEYVVRLSMDFANEQKFKKMVELRKCQRDLPIAERKDDIVKYLETSQVLIIAGDTGCGKSTQVPQYLLQAGYSGIACTQPRRIACTALARRVAFETMNTYGTEIAYQIRFESTKSKRTKVLFLTEGLLLRQMERDPLLELYNVLIIDEVHERHLSSDLLVALLRDLCRNRPDLKLILMSATINLELFTGYFDNAPVIQVPGRLYPIQLKYHPIKEMIDDGNKKSHKINPEPYLRILELIDKEVASTERGDALIFLNGVAEITTVAETLKTYAELNKGWIVLMLHSTLSVEEQDRVFDVAPAGVRKCILSTNIAETSVTIDGIRFVIDSGKVNLIKYDPSSGIQKLSEFWVSKASANQRKGRAGRTGPGVCYRLYSQAQFDAFDAFTAAEIHRVSLQDMTLRMLSLNLALDVRSFPYLESPDEAALNEAIDTLKFHGVLHSSRDNHLTPLGHTLAKLPVEVPIAKMLVLGCVLGQLDVMLTVAAGLSVQSPFTNRSYRELDVVERRASLTSPMGDPFTLINVFRGWVLEKTSGRGGRRWTIENGIDEHRLYEISKLRKQYRTILEDACLVERPTDEETGANDSRQRRIEKGERNKLWTMKRDQRHADKTRKVLRADRHFDRILQDKEEQDMENETDPMKADVRSVEFMLTHDHRQVYSIRDTHKLRRRDAEVIRVAVAAGLYPHFSILDGFNKYRQGQELFVHTRSKPYTLIHPNSSMAQYHSESLDARADSASRSSLHQLPFYGLLLETTKPYICNVLPMPAAMLLVVAKKIISDDWQLVLVDDFVEMQFGRAEDCQEVMREVISIRRELVTGLRRRIRGKKHSERRIRDQIDSLASMLAERGGIDMGLKRVACPPKQLENVGVYMPDGHVDCGEDDEDTEDEVEEEGGEEEEEEEETEEHGTRFDSPADAMCPQTRREFESGEEEREKKPEKKESYYEKLLRMQREREGGGESAGKEEGQRKRARDSVDKEEEKRVKKENPMEALEKMAC